MLPAIVSIIVAQMGPACASPAANSDGSNGTVYGDPSAKQPSATSVQQPDTAVPVEQPGAAASVEKPKATVSDGIGTETPSPEGSMFPVISRMPGSHPKLALTLAGGGGRGAAEVGVLKVLEQAGLRPDFVAGSSMGAFVGALYCAGVPISTIENMYLDGEMKKAFEPIPLDLAAAKFLPGFCIRRLLGGKPSIALYSGRSIATLLRRHLPPNRMYIEQFPRPFAAIATNIMDTHPVWMTSGYAPEVVRASSSVPGIYKPVKAGPMWLADGGIRSNLPTRPANALGARVVVAVRMYATLKGAPPGSFRTVHTFTDRILSMLLSAIEADGTGGADVVIDPDIGNMPMYDFDPCDAKAAIAAGEAAARKMLPEIRRKLQEATAASAPTPRTAPAM